MQKLTVRAITAYYRSLAEGQEEVPLEAEHTLFDGRAYVVLSDRRQGQLLAIYRCMNRGELKRLKRWPADLLKKSSRTEAESPEQAEQPTAVEAPAQILLLDLIPLPRKAASIKPDDSGTEQADLF